MKSPKTEEVGMHFYGKCGNVPIQKMTAADVFPDVKNVSASDKLQEDVWMVWFKLFFITSFMRVKITLLVNLIST